MYSHCHRSVSRHVGLVSGLVLAKPLTTAVRPLHPGLSVLAIETSCDDSSVAVLSLENGDTSTSGSLRSVVNFHNTVTSDSRQHNGIHPLVALSSHHTALGELVQAACRHMSTNSSAWKPTLVTATRGPGMRANLAVGLSLAKGLAVAWDVPFLGSHHMQAHALTPRLCWTLQQHGQVVHTPTKAWIKTELEPAFPYLTVLASGGHTMLLQSQNLTEHTILAETQDIALGDCLDKAARAILPPKICNPPYGQALEQFAFPRGEADYRYTAPRSRSEELREHKTRWSWSLRMPLQDNSGLKTSRRMVYSYSGMLSQIERYMRPELDKNIAATRTSDDISEDERRDMAREVLRVAFEHLVSRVLLHLTSTTDPVNTIVISGGVASNKYLRHVLRQMLDARGFSHIRTVFPPVELCTDNALMIAWAGLEMYAAGYTTSLDVEPLRKWSMDSRSDDKGILGVPGWLHTG